MESAEYVNDAAAGSSITIRDIRGDKQLAGVQERFLFVFVEDLQ